MGLRSWDCQRPQLSISELSVVGGWWVGGMTGQTHFMVGPGRGPTKKHISTCKGAFVYWGSGFPYFTSNMFQHALDIGSLIEMNFYLVCHGMRLKDSFNAYCKESIHFIFKA